jgi:hypothetical protein
MAEKRDDDLKDSFYMYIMRHGIGAGLRSQYAPDSHMPDRLNKLIEKIEADAQKQGAETHLGESAGKEREEQKPPARRHVLKK